jgi:thiol-disulfide isomerase/thioredoxin
MKHVIIFIALALTLSMSAQTKGIEFLNDTVFENVLAKAKAENKLIFMDCYAVWCGPCKYMAASVFPDETLGEFHNKHFINLKYDMEKPYGAGVRKKYGIRAYPSFLYLNGDGEVVHRSVGSTATAADFLKVSQRAIDPERNFKAVNARIVKGDRNASTVSDYLDMNYGATNADTLINDFFNQVAESEKLSSETWQLISNHVVNTKSPVFAFFVKNKKEFESRYGKKEVDDYLYNVLSYVRRKDASEYENLKNIDPEVFNRHQLDMKKREEQRQKK